ncbi:MAG TPA: polysaccharide deacetylase family protein [Candidatus Paceibacterota bacterium]|nr:polysaccharide deacetylase family protein [Candidatus Paceibacterota bacterium]
MNNIKRIILRTAARMGLNELAGSTASQSAFCIGYHSIRSRRNSKELSGELYWNLSIDEEEFDAQITYLKKHGHTFVTVGNLLNAVKKGIKKPTAIYFDDGYRDNLLNALPILKKHAVPATVFVTTGAIDRTCLLWTLSLRNLYRKIGKENVEEEIAKLKDLLAHEAAERVDEVYRAHGLKLDSDDFDMFLSWEEVGRLAQEGIEIGSHTVTHPNLTKVDAARMNSELVESKSRIEEKIGVSVGSLSYPYGRVNGEVADAARAAGYRCAIGGVEGWNSFRTIQSRRFELRKIAPRPGGDIVDFATRMYLFPLRKRISEFL